MSPLTTMQTRWPETPEPLHPLPPIYHSVSPDPFWSTNAFLLVNLANSQHRTLIPKSILSAISYSQSTARFPSSSSDTPRVSTCSILYNPITITKTPSPSIRVVPHVLLRARRLANATSECIAPEFARTAIYHQRRLIPQPYHNLHLHVSVSAGIANPANSTISKISAISQSSRPETRTTRCSTSVSCKTRKTPNGPNKKMAQWLDKTWIFFRINLG